MATIKSAISPVRAENFPEWYQEVVKAADLAEHSSVRGCMIIKPLGYGIWELVHEILGGMIKETGHQNVYFPMLIPLSFLAKEADHVEGFAKECAVVTHYRLEVDAENNLIPSPDAQLSEPLIIRPTSETVIGTAMAKWIQSYKDLPVLINQWCNIMRWEMRTRLFLRTSEFLWQEGHTAHASAEEAITETLKMLDVYAQFLQDYMAIPVIKGEKTPAERFPGAINTYTVEAMMQDGKALQSGTSHFLGQNFSRAYDMKFTDSQQNMTYAWTTSWGSSTRMIGGLIMTHSDDDGLVLPPRMAPTQIVLIPVVMNEEDAMFIAEYCESLAKDLRQECYQQTKVRVTVDKSQKRVGEKFWDAVKKGTPLRIEIGKREIESNQLSISRRDKPAKEKLSMSREHLIRQVGELLNDIQTNLFNKALDFREKNTFEANNLAELERLFQQDETSFSTFVIAYFDPTIENDPAVNEKLKSLKITTRCIPFDYQTGAGRCIFSGKEVDKKVIFARAY